MKNKKIIVILLILTSLFSVSLILLNLFKSNNISNDSYCNHDKVACSAIDKWEQYKDSNNFSTTYETFLKDRPKTKHVYIKAGDRLAKIIYFENDEKLDEIIFTDKIEYEINVNTGTYKNKELTTSRFFEKTPKDDGSSVSLFVDAVLENDNLFDFKFISSEKCEQNNCNKYQIIPTATDETFKKVLNLQDYQLSNLRGNTYYIWINNENYQIYRAEDHWSTGQIFLLTYDFSNQNIELPK